MSDMGFIINQFDGSKPKTCKFCGDGDFYWADVNGVWRLVDEDGDPHDCNKEDKDLENDLIEQLKRRLDGADKGNPK